MQILNLRLNPPAQTIPIFVGQALWQEIRKFLKDNFSTHQTFVISDENVVRIYGEQIENHFRSINRYGGIISFPAGEESKSRQWKAKLEDQLFEKKAGRDSLIVAIGGGVTGDLAGYVASSLHRGIPLIQVPTSVLAQVDSSVGGKVGINHPTGKNLLGSFHQPRAIFSDISLLATLPDEEYFNGLAEVIKYAVILDKQLFDFLLKNAKKIKNRDESGLKYIITKSISLKIKVVELDEQEESYRTILNFGHTLGHAIEKLTNFKIKHGFAIAAGMMYAVKLSHQKFGYPDERIKTFADLLKIYQLNSVDISRFSEEKLWETTFSDKKVRQNKPHFSLLDDKENARLLVPITFEEFRSALRSG